MRVHGERSSRIFISSLLNKIFATKALFILLFKVAKHGASPSAKRTAYTAKQPTAGELENDAPDAILEFYTVKVY